MTNLGKLFRTRAKITFLIYKVLLEIDTKRQTNRKMNENHDQTTHRKLSKKYFRFMKRHFVRDCKLKLS